MLNRTPIESLAIDMNYVTCLSFVNSYKMIVEYLGSYVVFFHLSITQYRHAASFSSLKMMTCLMQMTEVLHIYCFPTLLPYYCVYLISLSVLISACFDHL